MKLCECGCEREVEGWTEGCSARFIQGHNGRQPVLERFWSKVDKGPDDACWEWQGGRSSIGHGHFALRSDRKVQAHRFAYEKVVGPIPEGLVLDHLCRNPPCCNPAHLEPVTRGENTLRGDTVTGNNMRKTVCVHGHKFTPETTYVTKTGGRHCLICRRAAKGRYRKQRAQGPRPIFSVHIEGTVQARDVDHAVDLLARRFKVLVNKGEEAPPILDEGEVRIAALPTIEAPKVEPKTKGPRPLKPCQCKHPKSDHREGEGATCTRCNCSGFSENRFAKAPGS